MNLKPYAAHHLVTKGRRFKEPLSPLRNEFQRDRDRIIHCTSFRRLQYKTQVFVSHEGDMFRNRLTHSLEVSQVSRGIARTLGCHEDLAEAIALAHDLGHTPFGHAGQDALNCCMKNFGGFEHNLQSLRVVDQIESRYANFAGLNLTFETREGILKHCSKKNAKQLGDIGRRFLDQKQPSLEAQIVNIADEIAYCHHDIDDGFRSKILTLKDLQALELFNRFYELVKKLHGLISDDQMMNESLRRMMQFIIVDLCQSSLEKINDLNPKTVDEVRGHPPLVIFSATTSEHIRLVKQFSRESLYNHPKILAMSEKAKAVITKLFSYFMTNPNKLPLDYQQRNNAAQARSIADYIAGMTDRYALAQADNLV
jgi:dGTPase